MQKHLADYLEYLAIRNYSPATIKNRQDSLRGFFIWANDRDLIRAKQITRPILEGYQRWMFRYRKKNGRPLGVRTQVERLRAVQGFFSWLCLQNHLVANPASELVLPRMGKRLPIDALSQSEVAQILARPDLSDPLGLRDRAIIELLYSTGIRRMEVVNLQLTDLNAERGTLSIRGGKGDKDRVVPLGSRAMLWLDKYLEASRPELSMEYETTLFLSCYGRAFSRDVLGRLVGKYVKEATGKQGGCHLFRHTCATHMLENGADTRFIQQLLGHASLETTQIYTQVTIMQLKEVHARTHPSEK